MTYILGVNAGSATWHDASACLTDEAGRVLAFVEQERLTRHRHAPKDHMPADAVARVAELAGIAVEAIDAVAVGWDEPRLRGRTGQCWRFDSRTEFLQRLGLPTTGRTPDLYFVDHHRAHAASAFYASPYPAAAVVVIDGNGEDEALSIYRARRGQPQLRLAAWPQVYSLGHLYEAVSRWLGLGKFGAGKVMGLASYGLPVTNPGWLTMDGPDLRCVLGTDATLVYEDLIRRWATLLVDHTGSDRTATAPHELADNPGAVALAAAAQTTVESVVTALVAQARARTGLDEVCLAGGVALNCAANGRLDGPLYIPPAPHDAGVALGAAWALQPPAEPTIFCPYTGGTPGPSPQLADGVRVETLDVDVVTQALLAGQVVGVCRGRSEAGPRALCHRSLLASPINPAMRDHVNAIKRREPWRPFGPVSPMGVDHGLWAPIGHLERYMLGATTLTAQGEQDIPAVRHIDATTRPQRLSPEDEPFVHELLTALTRAGHPPVLLNTSFNGPGEPLVETATEAVACASRLGVPICVIDDVLIRFPHK